MSETKLYGIQKTDGTILEDEFPDLWLERNSDALKSGLRQGETIVPVVILSADRLHALEARLEWIRRNEGDPVAISFALKASDNEVIRALGIEEEA